MNGFYPNLSEIALKSRVSNVEMAFHLTRSIYNKRWTSINAKRRD